MGKHFITRAVTLLLLFCSTEAASGQSLYQDVKATQVGDVITVILTENISGSASTDAATRSSTSGDMSGSVEGNFIPFEPLFGSDASVNYDSGELASTDQQQLLEGTISVIITDRLDNGNLQVEGERTTEINGEIHKMEVAGQVRPNDIDNQNRILSFRIADAVINYQKEESLSASMRKPGFMRRVVFGGLAAALGGAVLIYELR